MKLTAGIPGLRGTLGRTRATIAALGAAVILVVLAGVVGVAARDLAAADARAADRAELRSAAPAIVERVFSVDLARWRADRAAARAVTGGDFARSYAAALDGPPPAGTAAVRWQVDAVAVGEAGHGAGETLLHAVVTTRAVDGVETTRRTTVRTGFTGRDGHWVLTSMEVLA
ncbi:MAG: hypothetical protein QM662_18865 [Gordonia sp. (in: high G+C Gram-positive bacteria)]